MPLGHNLGPLLAPKGGFSVSVFPPSFICPIIPSIYCPHFPFLCSVHHPTFLLLMTFFFAIFYCFPRPKTILPIFISFQLYPKMHSTLQNGSSSMPIVGNSPFQHSSIQQANILAQSESPATATGKAETTQNGDGNQLQVILTIRMLMQGKEVGSIIGKKGDYVRQIREQSGAKVNISDGSCPERIVTILGTANAIDKAFTMIAKKFEDDLQALQQQQSASITPPITLRLIIPASQCGSLIGKGGAKIREIRDKTGASLQVASEMLSNSTEKPVTISGSSDALIGCMREICQILLDAPAKGPTIQYKPVNTAYNPMAVVNSAAAIAAAAAAQKNKSAGTAAGLPFGIPGHLQAHQLSALLPAMANPLQASLHELALLQQQSQHAANPFVDVSRFFLPTTAQSAAQTASASAVLSAQSAAVLPNPNAALLAAMSPALIATSTAQNAATAYKTNQNGLEQLYGLDPMTMALLAQQNSAAGTDYSAAILAAQFQQKASDPSQIHQQQQILQHQQQIQMLYQQQQAVTGGVESTGNHSQLSGRTIGSNGQALKENGTITNAGTSASSIHQQIAAAGNAQKRFTPY